MSMRTIAAIITGVTGIMTVIANATDPSFFQIVTAILWIAAAAFMRSDPIATIVLLMIAMVTSLFGGLLPSGFLFMLVYVIGFASDVERERRAEYGHR